MTTEINEDDLDFSTDLVTGKCQACKEGRHLDCRSLGAQQSSADVYPFFSDEEDDLPPRPPSDWVCGCLTDATARRNHAKHYGVLE